MRQYEKASASGLNVRALALINPGNPTGQVLSADAVLAVCRFCAARGIVLLADEVYQRNVYADGARFVSAKKAALDGGVGAELELVSFHSTSKGLIGECGRRGGYMELHNIDADVHAQLYKLASAGLCSGVAGQVMTSLMVRPPAPGDDSHAAHAAEEAAILTSLRSNAELLVDGLNAIPGITCNAAEGAMYAFARRDARARARGGGRRVDERRHALRAQLARADGHLRRARVGLSKPPGAPASTRRSSRRRPAADRRLARRAPRGVLRRGHADAGCVDGAVPGYSGLFPRVAW